MTSQRRMLLILEDGIVPEESIQFTLKFAKRMDYAILVLMLADYPDNRTEGMQALESTMNGASETIQLEGIRVQSEIRLGDKASQFLKYIAMNPSIMAIVWGSDDSIVTGKRRKRMDHWFSKVRLQVQCPIVAPRARRSIQNKSKNNT